MKREDGYYYVIYDNKEWEIARWNGLFWRRTRDCIIHNDDAFDIIGERILMPDEENKNITNETY